MLNELPDRNAIRIVLLQENVNAAERVSALIQEVISECMPHLCCKLMLPAPPAAGPAGPKHAQLEFAYPPFDTSGHLLPLDLIRTVASAHGEDGRLWSGGKELLGTELHSLYALWLPSMGKLSSYDILLSYRHSAKLDSECVLKVTDGCGSGTPDFLFGSSTVILWHRLKDFQQLALALICERLLLATPTYSDLTTLPLVVPGGLAWSTPTFEVPVGLYISQHNPEAKFVAGQLSERFALSMVDRSTTAAANLLVRWLLMLTPTAFEGEAGSTLGPTAFESE